MPDNPHNRFRLHRSSIFSDWVTRVDRVPLALPVHSGGNGTGKASGTRYSG